jgi:dTDP-4-amino-4,6-dideoxygalactose transaminase
MPMNMIPQTYPRNNYLIHKPEIDEAVAKVLDSGWYILGQELENFEREFASYLGAKFSIGVSSGTDALCLALRACGVGPNDLVFTVSHTAVATVAAIELVGAIPVLVDIETDHYTMDPNHLEDLVKFHSSLNGSRSGYQPKAIIPVHLYGHPADMPAIMAIAQRYDLLVIEDCAQSHGASFLDRKTGTWGDLAAFSFYPTKNLGAFGDGGMVVTNNPEFSEKTLLLRQYGWRNRYISVISGNNSRLDELQAAMLRVLLPHLDRENEKRKSIADIYDSELSASSIQIPKRHFQALHVYHQYVVRSPERENLQSFLSENRINTGIHYPVPVHKQPAYSKKLQFAGTLPNTEKVATHILSLPMYPYLGEDNARYVTEVIKKWDARGS